MQRNTHFSLRNLLEAGVSPKNLLKLLLQTDIEKFPKAHLLVNGPDSESVHQLLDFITDCIKSNLSVENALELLRFKNSTNSTIGLVIAECHPAETTQYYLNFLINLIKLNVPAKEIFATIQVQNNTGWTLGFILVHKFDAETTQAYLSFLRKLMEYSVSAQEILALLQIVTATNDTLGHFIAFARDAASTRDYLHLLNDLIQSGVNAKEIFALVSIKNSLGNTLGHLIAGYQDEGVMQSYLRLLMTCLKAGCRARDVYDLLTSPMPKKNLLSFEKNILSPTVHKSNACTIYLLVKTRLLHEADYYALASYKEIVFAHILTLSKNDKIYALKSALKPDHTFNKLFKLKSSLLDDPNILLGKIKRELKKLLPNKNQSINKITNFSTAATLKLIPIYIPVHHLKDQKMREETIKEKLSANPHIEKSELLSYTPSAIQYENMLTTNLKNPMPRLHDQGSLVVATESPYENNYELAKHFTK